MENTTENKAKFAMQYYNQPVLYKGYYHELLAPVTCDKIRMFWEAELGNKMHLSLRSISSLTDEEAKRLSSIWYPGLPESDPRLIQWGKHIASLLKDWNLALGELRFNQAEHMISYLRSIGILIPWMDLSVEQIIEYGWAKEDTSC